METKMSSKQKKRAPRRQGAAVIEMALTLPVLFLLLFACYEFGRANMIRHTAQGAAYEAARVAIVPGATRAEAAVRTTRKTSIKEPAKEGVSVSTKASMLRKSA